MRRPTLLATLLGLLPFTLGLVLALDTAEARGRPAGHRAKSAVKAPGKVAKGRARPRGRARPAPPIAALTKSGLPNIQAASAIIVDLDTGKELYSKNADEVRPIASVGKLFLALTVRAKGIDLAGSTAIADEDQRLARGGARSRLPVGKLFNNHDLLRAMLISSDNRACSALGRAVGWTPEKLVKAMNETAKTLGLKRTRFEDPSGLHGNASTAREVVAALRGALGDPVLSAILQTPMAQVRSLGAAPVVIDYYSTDLALRTEKRFPVLGGKTGYTDEARYCLAIAAKIGGRRVGMVFLGAEGKLTRFADFNRGVTWLQSGGGATGRTAPATAMK
jgi:D-alanyl-D-alanine endopeptidase (penicillin-binding protein 7)